MLIWSAAAALAAVAAYAASLAWSRLRALSLSAETMVLEQELLREKIGRIADQRRFERERDELSWSGFRKFRVQEKKKESEDICSFYLAPHDGKPLPPFKPGQFLAFRVAVPGEPKPLVRCYSLSCGPQSRDFYRVTIKKAGLVSSFFHERLQAGDIVDVKAPSGNFVLEASEKTPVVLLGSGVGVTPLLSMLEAIAAAGSEREAWFVYGARDRQAQIMRERLGEIARAHPNVRLVLCHSQPGPEEVAGRDYDHSGRISLELLKGLLPGKDYAFYLCGPPAMLNEMRASLKDWGVPPDRVFHESFGSATVKNLAAPAPASAASFTVRFTRSGKTAAWSPGSGSLLELAEKNGVAIDSGCRTGGCGTCLTALKGGQVKYLTPPGHLPEEGSCLACIAVPKDGDVSLEA